MSRAWRSMRMPAVLTALLVAASVSACSHTAVRFADRPPVTTVNDDADIPEPAETKFYRYSHHLNNFGDRQLRLRLDPVPAVPAEDVNSMGEVPNSSWLHNRVSDVTPEQVARGAGSDDPGPEAFFPWKVTGMKVGGANCRYIRPRETVHANLLGLTWEVSLCLLNNVRSTDVYVFSSMLKVVEMSASHAVISVLDGRRSIDGSTWFRGDAKDGAAQAGSICPVVVSLSRTLPAPILSSAGALSTDPR
jgi:hypothetical protein